MKLVYAVSKDGFRDKNHVGVRKKVFGMINTFEKQGIECKLCEYEWENGMPLFEVDRDTDVLYFRRLESSVKLILKLSKLKRIAPKLKVIMEIPTYPFKGETIVKTSLKRKISLLIGAKLLNFFVDRIVLTGDHPGIFSLYKIPVINIYNGVDTENIKIGARYSSKDEIHLIAVSGCYFWHGYDRLIRGLSDYYLEGNKTKVYFHIVGDGDCLEEYKTLVNENAFIKEYVIFEGILEGKELAEIFDKCHVAIDCLGCHRKGIYSVSSLKVPEYGVKGLPIITSVNSNLMNGELRKFFLMLPSDESNIEVGKILEFYFSLCDEYNKDDLPELIRSGFIKYCDWERALAKLIVYMKEERK